MTGADWRFTSSIERPDGVVVTAVVTSPDRKDVGELAEVAQMAASHGAAVASRITRTVDDHLAEQLQRPMSARF